MARDWQFSRITPAIVSEKDLVNNFNFYECPSEK